MITVGTITDLRPDGKGGFLIGLRVADGRMGALLEDMQGRQVVVDIKPQTPSRTLSQNALMWEIIGRICKSPNAQHNEPWDMYCHLLMTAGAKCTYVKVLNDAVDTLRQNPHMRAIQVLGHEQRKGRTWALCRLFIGSSQMTTKEMATLLNAVIDYAEGLGIPTGDLIC